MITQILLLALVTIASGVQTAWTKVEYDSNQLLMKNADEVGELVRKKLKRAQDIQAKQEVDDDTGIVASSETIDQLTDALRIALARPDQDGARANLVSRIRRDLQDMSSQDEVFQILVKESLAALKDSKTSVRHQITYITILENLMAEIKPDLASNTAMKDLVVSIRDAKIKVSDKARRQQMSRSMSKVVSPSETADKILPKENKK